MWIKWEGGGRPFVDLQAYTAEQAVQGSTRRLIGGDGPDGLGGSSLPIMNVSGFRRYHKTFQLPAGAAYVHFEQGADLNATPKPGAATSLFDDLLLTEGACPAGGA